MLKRSLLGMMLLLLLPLPAMAIPTITCHCFTDRSYDPARPAAADPYFLATTQNSFFAAVFGTDKKSLVMKKQKGTLVEDLWVAYGVADSSGASAEGLLQARQEKNSWREVLEQQGIAAESLGPNFARVLTSGGTDGLLAQAVVDDLFTRFRLIDGGDLAAIRTSGASNQELIIATLVSRKTGESVQQVLQDVKVGPTSWGALLDEAKIDAAGIAGEITALLKSTAA